MEKDMRFGTENVMSLYRSGSLTAVTWELTSYKLGLMGVQEGRWDKGSILRPEDYIFLNGKGN
jgi:hypothetical protein